MKKVTYSDPMGDLDKNLKPEKLRELVFQQNDNYWQTGCAEATLRVFEDEEKLATVYLSGIKQHGFKVEHKYEDNNERTYILKVGEHTGKTVEMMNPAGEDGFYFREYFAPKEIAWQAINYFLKTGERDPSLTWEIAQFVEGE